jgi:spore maturation protein CgeB
MKFIIPGPSGPDSFQENVAHALRSMGHEVLLARPPRFPRARRVQLLYEDLFQRAVGTGFPADERWLLKAARAYRPDAVLCTTMAISESSLRDLRTMGVRHLIAWWGDAPGNMVGMGLLVDGWDAIFVKDPDTVRKLLSVKLNAHLLHEAMNPAWHRPVAAQCNEKLVMVGNYYGYRQLLALRLLRDGVDLGLYGTPLPRWAKQELRSRHAGRYVVKEDKSRVFGEALACLNSTSLLEGNSLNCRAFEIAGAAGFQLLEDKPIVEQCFEPGKEVVTYSTYEELTGAIERAKKYPADTLLIRRAALRRAVAEHTYQHRLKTMFGILGISG